MRGRKSKNRLKPPESPNWERKNGGGRPRGETYARTLKDAAARLQLPVDLLRMARAAGFVTVRRSELSIDTDPRADVVVLDTIGELAQLYQVATAVFVGGSLVDHGGHNILEPAVFGKPILFGPHMQNFKEIADTFLANGAAVQVASEHFDETLLSLLTDPVRRARLGAAARALVEANRGAKEKTLAVIAEIAPTAASHGVVRSFRLVN
jgi:3-deoxy-D-manno-octulosonic-acid transferase